MFGLMPEYALGATSSTVIYTRDRGWFIEVVFCAFMKTAS